MIETPFFEHHLTLDAATLRAMEHTHELTDDIHCQYLGMLNFLDQMYYRNGNSSFAQIRTRQSVFTLAQAMPSLAILDPDRTREITYNLNVCGIVMDMPLLTCALDGFNSEPIRLVETALILAFYRLVGGRSLHDGRFHECARLLYEKMRFNGCSMQQTWGVETCAGIYQIVPNLWALMAFRIHDRIFGTDYSRIEPDVMQWIRRELIDSDTGLFREYYKTGAFGIPDEKLCPEAFWHSTTLPAHVNALCICYMHYFDPEIAERAWKAFKPRFLPELLALRTEDIADGTGRSYLTQLAPATEALYGALLAAKELRDDTVFEQLQRHIFAITGPSMRENKLFLDDVQEERLHGYYLLLARAHVGWENIMSHDWAPDYMRDYKKVR